MPETQKMAKEVNKKAESAEKNEKETSDLLKAGKK
jgi:hypothetical protein